MVQNLNFLTWRDFLALKLDESGLESFPSGTFTNFGRPMAKNCDLVFLTEVRPNGTKFKFFFLKRLFCWGVWRKRLGKFPSRNFYQFWTSYLQKLRFSLFDQGATKTWDWFLDVRINCPKFEFSYLERLFCPGAWQKWLGKFPSRNFYQFWPSYAQKLRFGLFNKNVTKCRKSKFFSWRDFLAPKLDESG